MAGKRRIKRIHPGVILLEEFLEPMNISQYRLAKDIGVPTRRVNEIVLGRRGITPDMALRLSIYFGLSDSYWMNMQSFYDLQVEKHLNGDQLKRQIKAYAA
jgi:antitoxin HigA-1